MRKSFKFKLYKSKSIKGLHRQINLASSIYNHLIALHKTYYRLFGKYPSKYEIQKHFTRYKKIKRFRYWNDLGSQTIQDIVERVDRAYRLFFKSLKRCEKRYRPPSFKKKSKYKSFTLKQCGYKLLDDNKIRIGNRVYKYSKSREIEGKIKTVTIKRDTLGDVYLFFSCDRVEKPKIERTSTGKIEGFDFGLKTFLTSSTGEKIRSPQFFKIGSNRVKVASKIVSSKKKGSNNRRKAVLSFARVHRKIVNQRRDFHFKLTRRLALDFDVICIETLNIGAMKKLWGRKISDLGFSDFVLILQHMCNKLGSTLWQADQFYPSSKTCSYCGWINENLSLRDCIWTCQGCQTKHDRDQNAGMNLKREGASSLGLESIRPTLLATLV